MLKKKSENIPASLSCSGFLNCKKGEIMEPLVHWSHEETQALIGVWSEERIQRDLEESFRNETVYREMSGRLAALGISRSAKQCRAKIKKLKQEYRNTRRHGERSEAVTKTFRWYDAMDTIMGDKSARTQSRERPSSVVLEVMVPDVEASKLERNKLNTDAKYSKY